MGSHHSLYYYFPEFRIEFVSFLLVNFLWYSKRTWNRTSVGYRDEIRDIFHASSLYYVVFLQGQNNKNNTFWENDTGKLCGCSWRKQLLVAYCVHFKPSYCCVTIPNSKKNMSTFGLIVALDKRIRRNLMDHRFNWICKRIDGFHVLLEHQIQRRIKKKLLEWLLV
jgi:hypothetical protein